jgi:hypothetical protein
MAYTRRTDCRAPAREGKDQDFQGPWYKMLGPTILSLFCPNEVHKEYQWCDPRAAGDFSFFLEQRL